MHLRSCIPCGLKPPHIKLRKRSPDGPRMNGGYKRENLLSHHLVILSTADVMLVKDDPPVIRMQNPKYKSGNEIRKPKLL